MPFKRSHKFLIISAVFIIVVMVFLLLSRKAQINPVTGEEQQITLTPDQEITLGIESAPQLAIQFGGIYQKDHADEKIKSIGRILVSSSDIAKSPYQFDFHVLADSHTVDAFALPGGQIFLTLGLYKKLKTNDEIAVILSHQIGHIIGRHASEKLFKSSVFEGISTQDTILVKDFSPRMISKYLSDLITLNYDEEEENEADHLGIGYATQAGFNPDSFSKEFFKEKNSNKKSQLFFDKHCGFLKRKRN
ncbi:M48 family metalloprotease [Dyadobacter sp. CY345]|uniref:M48 family metalloprotease n=1 Tax=Dyadobacter sp. CY345 TaxID=2909335 RepID=UPI001F45E68D|nr:M48 family metalloprotease [Dyadobacter sp. CY345]MCF2444655.1 M48 family metalloprotease [Dyadobacter sp. CY345]